MVDPVDETATPDPYSVEGMADTDRLAFSQQQTMALSFGLLERMGHVTNLLRSQASGFITAGSFRSVEQAIRDNEGAIKARVQEIAAHPDEINAAELMQIQAAMGILNPDFTAAIHDIPHVMGTPEWLADFVPMMNEFATTGSNAVPPIPVPTAENDDFSSYYMNNIVLSHPGYSADTRQTWQIIQENPDMSAGEAIQYYISSVASQYFHENQEVMPGNDRLALQEHLRAQIVHLRNIEATIADIELSPEQIADAHIQRVVLPDLSDESRRAWTMMQETDISLEQALESFDSSHHELISLEIQAIQEIRAGIITFEGASVSIEGARNLLEESWSSIPSLPHETEHYSSIFDQKLAYFQSPAGGSLDSITAISRAAIDVRAIIDEDMGVPSQSIVNQNHEFYAHDVMQMGNWIKSQVIAEDIGTISAEDIASYGNNQPGMSRLDYFSAMYGGGYSITRSGSVQAAMQQAIEQIAAPAPTPEAEAEPDADIEEETELTAPEDWSEEARLAFTRNDPFATGSEFESVSQAIAEFSEQLRADIETNGNRFDFGRTLETHALYTGVSEATAQGNAYQYQTQGDLLGEDLGYSLHHEIDLSTTDPEQYTREYADMLKVATASALNIDISQIPEQWSQSFEDQARSSFEEQYNVCLSPQEPLELAEGPAPLLPQ